LPNILKARELKEVAKAAVAACKKKKPLIFMCGAHVIKCGLNPVIIELMKRRIITFLALNGAGIIHDFEIAYQGQTSEDVSSELKHGRFGMCRQTPGFLNQAIKIGVSKGLGIGEAIGQALAKENLTYKRLSILYQAYRYKIAVSVHIAIGTDVIHQHPNFDAGLTAEGSLRDFHRLVEAISKLGEGGLVLNFGSSVILPEVFLKALNLARNLGFKVRNFTTANFDMIYHYRPAQNVVQRPILSGGRGYYIIGHHEIMLPLLAQAIIEKI
jgi:deoxyhypusine synthase